MNITFLNYKKVFQKNICHLKVKQKKWNSLYTAVNILFVADQAICPCSLQL